MPSDILIIPNRNSTTVAPVMLFSGSQGNSIRLEVLTSGSLAFLGKSGSLFSISDNFSGSLMAVGDISGLPILEVFSDDRVVMGRFNSNALVVTGSNVGIGKSNPNPAARLDVSGSVFISGSTSITGSLTVSVPAGTAATFSTPGGGFVSFTNGLIDSNSSQFGFKAGVGSAAYIGANNSQHLTVTTAGNIAIGKTTANAVLDVVGNSIITGSLNTTGQIRSNLANSGLSNSQFIARNSSASGTNGAVSQISCFGQPGYTTFVGTTGDGTNASYQGAELGSAVLNQQGYVISDAANGLLIHSINGSVRFATGNPGTQKMFLDSGGSLTVGTAGSTRLVLNGGGGGSTITEYYLAESFPRWAIGRDLITGGQAGIGFSDSLNTIATTGGAVAVPSTRVLAFYTSNATTLTERMRIDGSGNVAIGKTTANAVLDVLGNAVISGSLRVTGSQILASDGTSALPGLSFINDSNSGFFKVPAAPDVIYVGVNGGNTLRFSSAGLLYAGNSNAYLQLGNAGAVNINADGTNQNITLTPVGSGYVNVVQSTSTVATNNYALTVGIGATSDVVSLGNHTNYAWLQSFNSRPLSINPLGNNVGIGPTAPAKALEVNRNNATTSIGSGEVVRIIGDDGNTLNTVTELGFGTGPTGGTYAPIVLGAVVTTNTGYNIKDFYIATRNTTTDTAPSERVRITGAGNVGIGKTPTTKLDVLGNVFITGSLSVTDGVAAPADYKNNLHPFLFITFL